MRLTLRGARLVDADLDLPRGDITLEDGRILAVGEAADAGPGRSVDAAGLIVMPGFIDVHTHGGGGHNLHTATPDEIHAYGRWAPRSGVTAFLVGIVGTPGDLPELQIRAAAAAIEGWHAGAGAEPLGIHLEGPYISVERRGAHLPAWLRTPDPVETERILTLAGGHLRLVTLAPELPGAHAMIARLVAAGVTVSIGHTDASYEQALEAITLGATHATHCCNAMRPLLHRDPGPLGAIALSPGVAGELIADGVHVHPAMAQVMIKLLGSDRTILITDALAGAGSDNGAFEFAGQDARVVGGAARLADGTLTGSVLTMDQALRNVVALPGISLSAASAMLSRNPARAARASERMGRLAPGYQADLALLDGDLALCATLSQGAPVYASAEWTSLLSPEAAARRARPRGQL
jgi:N-acetylglucosamine-6-phosphate deacetylase